LSELATQQITAYLAGSSKHKPATFASPSSVEKNIAAIESLLSSRVAATTGAAVNVTTLRSARNVNGRALRADLAALASAPSAGTLILYLCGAVAAGPPPGRYYFLPSDANPGDLTNTAIPLAEIASLMAGSRSRRAAIIADFPWDPAVRPPANTFLLAAARQVPAKPPRESPKGNSPFTYAVIEALSGAADNDRNGRIDVREFADFVILRTGKLTKGELRPYAVNASANIVIAHPGRQNR
jgi:hypothetical protein